MKAEADIRADRCDAPSFLKQIFTRVVTHADAPGGIQLLLAAPGVVGRGRAAKAKNAFTTNAAIMLHRAMITK